MKLNLLEAKASEIVSKVKAQEISAQEVLKFFMDRSKRLNGELNAFVSFNENALKEAEAIDQKISNGEDPGILAGLPVGLKDLLNKTGTKTTAASKILENYESPYDATAVERLEAQGAIILGKTNLDEFAMGSSNENSYFGQVKNPWDVKKVPGGSSGGSAAAVAARMVPVSIGTDTGGSIRQPASFCGVVGIKPTYGSVSRYGVVAFASSLDQVGPMGTYVEDCELVLRAIAGHDPKDATTAEKPVEDYLFKTNSLEGLRVGLPKEYFDESLNKDKKQKIESYISLLKANGVEFIEIDLPNLPYAIPTYYVVASSEASSNLSRYDGVRYGYRSENAHTLQDLYVNSRSESFGEEVKRRIMLGTFALSSGYYDAFYKKARQVRALIQKDFLEAFQKCDLILSPVTRNTAFKMGEKIDDPLEMYKNDIYTISANLAGIPGLAVPADYDEQGMPFGIQIQAPHFEEARIFCLARAIEEVHNKNRRTPYVY